MINPAFFIIMYIFFCSKQALHRIFNLEKIIFIFYIRLYQYKDIKDQYYFDRGYTSMPPILWDRSGLGCWYSWRGVHATGTLNTTPCWIPPSSLDTSRSNSSQRECSVHKGNDFSPFEFEFQICPFVSSTVVWSFSIFFMIYIFISICFKV